MAVSQRTKERLVIKVFVEVKNRRHCEEPAASPEEKAVSQRTNARSDVIPDL